VVYAERVTLYYTAIKDFFILTSYRCAWFCVWVGTTSKFSEMGDTVMQQLLQLLQGSVVAKIFDPSG